VIPGADEVYTVRLLGRYRKQAKCYSRALGTEVYLEYSLLRPIVGGAQVGRYVVVESDQRVIYPYVPSQAGASLISPTVLKRDFPLAYDYFQQTRALLNARDRGSARGPRWYQYVRRQNIELQSKPKLAIPRLTRRLRAAYDSDGRLCFDNVDVGGVILRDPYRQVYLVVLALLNSRLLQFYFAQTAGRFRGGYYSANRQYIERLPIRIPVSGLILSLADRMLSLHEGLPRARAPHDKEVIQRQIDATDREIDRLVYELYGLTEKEVAIVEEDAVT
jgi:hypothetical protein